MAIAGTVFPGGRQISGRVDADIEVELARLAGHADHRPSIGRGEAAADELSFFEFIENGYGEVGF
ncbi:hypothetical protein D3C87_2128690 [compost metagenome]